MSEYKISFENFHQQLFDDSENMAYIEGHVLKDVALAFDKKYKSKPEDKEGKETCPLCSHALENIQYAYSSGIYIDRCHDCNLVVLSYQELTDIKKYFESLDSYNDDIAGLSVDLLREMNEARENDKEAKKAEGFFGRFF